MTAGNNGFQARLRCLSCGSWVKTSSRECADVGTDHGASIDGIGPNRRDSAIAAGKKIKIHRLRRRRLSEMRFQAQSICLLPATSNCVSFDHRPVAFTTAFAVIHSSRRAPEIDHSCALRLQPYLPGAVAPACCAACHSAASRLKRGMLCAAGETGSVRVLLSRNIREEKICGHE